MTDRCKFTEIYENTWVLDDQGVRIFLLAGKERALVIDTGITGTDVREAAKAVTDLPPVLLNTHADMDHIAGNGAFSECFLHPSEAAAFHHSPRGKCRILPVFDGDVIDLGGRSVEVVHIPGHTPGSISVLDREAACLIGGDPIQKNGDIYMFGPNRDMEAYVAGLERLMRRSGEFDAVYPSHAELRVGKEVIPELIRGARDILAGKIEGQKKEMHGMTVRSCDAGVSRFLCDL